MKALKNRLIVSNERHPFHLVDCSPWPIITSVSIAHLAISFSLYMHDFYSARLSIAFACLLLSIAFWFHDIILESTFEGNHTKKVRKGIKIGMSLFIISEVMFFFSLFWALFHFSLFPNIFIGCVWPPLGIEPVNAFGYAAIGTLILIVSGISLTYGHRELIKGERANSLYGILTTIIFGILFTILQFIEYINTTFSINDTVFGSIFFLFTGFHGFHVIIGTIMLIICFFRHLNYHFTRETHVGLDCAIWYWHLVDVVWIFVYLSLYKY